MEGKGHYFFYVFLCCIIFLLVFLRKRKIRFVFPAILITILIVNPFFYQKWTGLGLYSYWRVLWIIPIIPIVAATIPTITERIANREDRETLVGIIGKVLVSIVGIFGIIIGGTFLYNGTGGSFVEISNTAKIHEYVVQIADRLLELDEHPRVVVQDPIGVYIRQYTGKIDTLFGRDLGGYITEASHEAHNVQNRLSDPNGDLNVVATVMANENFDYLVIRPSGREEQLAEAGFEKIDDIAGFSIYKSHGKPNVIKDRNELGQVTAVTTVDENGKKVNGKNGYATISYEYDDNGYTIREFHTDINGFGVADSGGCAGYEREYDSNAHIIMERTIGPDGAAIINNIGYAEVRREYQGTNITKELYYDTTGNRVNRIDTYYAIIMISYDDYQNRIEERYYDATGNKVKSSDGYARVKRIYEQSKIIEEEYYDEYDEPIPVFAGYCKRMLSYDTAGNLIAETYYDETGSLTNCINGYACDERKYDSGKNIVVQRFLNADGEPVITGAGYAEVHRTFDGKHLILEEYYEANGVPYTQPAGYCAIEQIWDRDRLISRTYLGLDGQAINRIDGYSKGVWEKDEKGIWNVEFYDLNDKIVPIERLNLAQDIHYNVDGWSEWMTPNPNTMNEGFGVGSVNLGQKHEGDSYTVYLEIEFRDVLASEGLAFLFQTQGAVDNEWKIKNFWSPNIVKLVDVPKDGIYRYQIKFKLESNQANAELFSLGFRCDNWASGSFRVRNIKIEKGNQTTDWSPGL